jgi:hypothetical protein
MLSSYGGGDANLQHIHEVIQPIECFDTLLESQLKILDISALLHHKTKIEAN